jgi:L-seryl-tRNA(Ser) seleniumtransferase
MKSKKPLRAIPSVDQVIQGLGDVGLPRTVLVGKVRSELASLRRQRVIPGQVELLANLRRSLERFRHSRIQPVINGTGILIHTNLGRAPLSASAVAAVQAATGYCNLEYDLTRGERGDRAAYLEQNLAVLCGSQAATVVNNCAAALVLILRHFVRPSRCQVVISRGELIQIGGGFRIPEILEASGATLREVGTTNKTTLSDYLRALGPGTALILKVHRSNFFMGGFVDSPATGAIAQAARRKRIPFVEDLGSGAVVATEMVSGLEHEPTPAEALADGVDLVCFSGDKLLGGPQAGVIAGRRKWVTALKREPLFRALRCDKLILSALQATVDGHLGGSGAEQPPALAMAHLSPEVLRLRADRILIALRELPAKVKVVEGRSQMGGGALPRSTIPSVTIELRPVQISVGELAARLRAGTPPVAGVVSNGAFRIDLRTVFPFQDEELVQRLCGTLGSGVKI